MYMFVRMEALAQIQTAHISHANVLMDSLDGHAMNQYQSLTHANC